MISFDIENIGLNSGELSKTGDISSFLEKIEARDQGFYKIIDDESVLAEIKECGRKIQGCCGAWNWRFCAGNDLFAAKSEAFV